MEITAKLNNVLILKKTLEVSTYVVVFALAVPSFFYFLGYLLDKIVNPFSRGVFTLEVAGIGLFGIGAGILIMAIVDLVKMGNGLPASPVPATTLVTERLYGLSRHPIYFGSSLCFLGGSLFLHSFWCTFLSWPLFTLFFAAYALRVEEPVLEERFGDEYRIYRENVPLLWEFPFREALLRILRHFLGLMSRIVNRPFILEYRSHLLFLGYGLWVGFGVFVGLVVMSIAFAADSISASATAWLLVFFTVVSLAGSRFVSMVVLAILEKKKLRNTWYRVGFVSWGALLAAILTSALFHLLVGQSLYFWFDAAFLGLMINHFFGRIGCMFYGCCYGKETRSSISLCYTDSRLKAVREGLVRTSALYPTQLFSASYGLFTFLLAFFLWGSTSIRVGVPTSVCCILYGFFRFIEEWFRYQKRTLAGVLSPAQIVSLALMFLGMLSIGSILSSAHTDFQAPLFGVALAEIMARLNILVVTGMGLLTAFVFSYHRYEIGSWGKAGVTSNKHKESTMNLEYRNGELFCQDWSLSRLADEFGTPLYVLNRDTVQNLIRGFLAEFEARQLPMKIHYSVKTNPVPGFLKILKEEGLGVEVVFDHELELSKLIGFKGEDIVVNGASKTEEFLDKIKTIPVKMVTVESPGELAKVKAVAENLSVPMNVGLRICPGFSGAKMKPTLNSSAKDSPHGFLQDSPELWAALNDIGRSRNLRFVGFHVHLGSGIRDSRPYKKAFLILEEHVKKAAKLGLRSRLIDIGGGFGLAAAPLLTLPQMAKSALLKKEVKLQSCKESRLIREVAESLEQLLFRLDGSGNTIQEVLVEPGRILSGPSQILILSVLDTVERFNGQRFLICDGGAMSISPLLLTEYHKIIPLKLQDRELRAYTIMGNLPTSLDKVTSSLPLPPARCGDRLVVLDAGAYFVPMNNNFAGPRPAIFMVNGRGSGLIRRRETFEDLYQRDLL